MASASASDSPPDGHIVGIDEAGRGPWCGPVHAVAVIFPAGVAPDPGLTDSKKLTAKRREALYHRICETAWVGRGMAGAGEIDRYNVREATLMGMSRALLDLEQAGGPLAAADDVVVDGNAVPPYCQDLPIRAVPGADVAYAAVSAASVVAKVERDAVMVAMDDHYPGYGFGQHKGYGTAAHQAALDRLGPSPIHRRSFKPVRDRLSD